jgi:lipopolysaccharide assembly outer membrane protein LptD (OstA)
MERKKKLKLIQINLLVFGILIIFFTYFKKEKNVYDSIISGETQKQIVDNNKNGDVFYNIQYSGLDLSGNRYVLKSKEARNCKSDQSVVIMKAIEATFYFKDDTTLNVISENGVYNNRSLDIKFKGNVKAIYEKSELFAQEAEYSNSNGFLTITEDVKVKDNRGTMFADKLLFDIKKKTLNITSFKNSKVNANINLK